MKEYIVQIIMAAVGTLGFSIYFRVSEKNVAASTFGGALGWLTYLVIFHFTSNLFFGNFVAAAVVYFWSVIMARVLKAPSNVYLIPGVIPLLPGGTLYYTMRGIVDGDKKMFVQNGINTAVITFGMAAGMVAGTVILYYIKAIVNKRKMSSNKDECNKN